MKYFSLAPALALASALVLAAPVHAAEKSAKEGAEASQKSKKPKRITDRRDPNYVRCRSEPVIGSLAKKRRICMTNAEWVEYVRKGSRESQEFVDGLQSGMAESN